MRFLLLTREFPPHVIGGVAYHAYNLARRLVDRGHSVTVLTASTGDRTTDESQFRLDDLDVRRLSPRKRLSPRIWFARAVRTYLSETAALESIDLVHSHEFVDFGGLDLRVPTMQKHHTNLSKKVDYFPFENYPGPVRPAAKIGLKYGIDPLERSLARRAIESVDGHVFISDLTERIARDNHDVGGDHRTIYNGVDPDLFTPGGNSSGAYFLFVGGTQRRKGYETLRRAFDDVDVPLKIAGADRPTGSHVPSNVEFLGHVEQTDLRDLYRNARALVHPALYEPFGNVVLESLACGTPVIVSNADHCGATEVLTDDVATTVDPTEPEELRDALASFEPDAVDPDDCRALAERYPWDDIAERTVEFARTLGDE